MESGHCSSERLREEKEIEEAKEVEEAEELRVGRFLAVDWCESESRSAPEAETGIAVLVAIRKCFLLSHE
jgi:hypothetical protein